MRRLRLLPVPLGGITRSTGDRLSPGGDPRCHGGEIVRDGDRPRRARVTLRRF
jgi:hypothetical protein